MVGLGARSTSPLPATRDFPSSTWTSGGYKRSSIQTKPPAETHIEEVGQGDLEVQVEPSESEDHSQSPLRASNCRTYCRTNKGKHLVGADGFGNAFDSSSTASLKSGSSDATGKTVGRGRTRDYTVLHPSSVSVCNVTIQDSMDRGMEEFTSNTSAADPGEAGRLRKKVETETKPVR